MCASVNPYRIPARRPDEVWDCWIAAGLDACLFIQILHSHPLWVRVDYEKEFEEFVRKEKLRLLEEACTSQESGSTT